MTPAFTRLGRILELEEKQNYRNRAVIGGMGAMSERWAQDALAEEIHEAHVEAIVALMIAYEATNADRPALIAALQRALSEDFVPPVPAEGARDDADEATNAGVTASPEPAHPEFEDEWQELVDEDGMVYEAGLRPPEPTHLARERVRRQQPRVTRRAQDLQGPVTLISGVGPATAEQLARLGVNRVIDLLWHLPARHEDYSQLRTIAQLQPGEQVTIVANLWDVRERKLGIKRTMIQGILGDATGTLHATWWNKFVRNQLTPGTTMRFSGKVDRKSVV